MVFGDLWLIMNEDYTVYATLTDGNELINYVYGSDCTLPETTIPYCLVWKMLIYIFNRSMSFLFKIVFDAPFIIKWIIRALKVV